MFINGHSKIKLNMLTSKIKNFNYKIQISILIVKRVKFKIQNYFLNQIVR